MLEWFEGLLRGLPPTVASLLTSSFPFVAVAAMWLAYRANSRQRRGHAAVFGALFAVALVCTALWTIITWDA